MGLLSFALCLLSFITCEKGKREGGIPVPDQETFAFELEESVSGERLYRVSAKKAYLYEARGLIEVFGVKVFFFSDGRVGSILTCSSGKVFIKSSNLLAKGDVVVRTSDSISLWTDSLAWDNEERMIETDAFVKIATPRVEISGVGLVSDAELKRIRIKSDVSGKGDYEIR